MSWAYRRREGRVQSNWRGQCAPFVLRTPLLNLLFHAQTRQRAELLEGAGRSLSVDGQPEPPLRCRSRFAGATQRVRGEKTCRKLDLHTFQERNGKMRRAPVVRERRARRGQFGAVGPHREAIPGIERGRAPGSTRTLRCVWGFSTQSIGSGRRLQNSRWSHMEYLLLNGFE